MKYSFLLIGFLFLPTVFYGMGPDLEAGTEAGKLEEHLRRLKPLVSHEAFETTKAVLDSLGPERKRALQDKVDSFLEKNPGAGTVDTFIQGEWLTYSLTAYKAERKPAIYKVAVASFSAPFILAIYFAVRFIYAEISC